MRTLLVAAILMVPLGCAHREPRSLAQRSPTTTPRGDFDGAKRDNRRNAPTPIEPPNATPPVP